ncbi:hypothetical protein [Cryobacterium sp. Y11]|uniref:hypothetical protein n=1 Tax=Cryobacterium sp. Y11 TaxID=2045016 RepID=UPI001304CA36|nr:hypothetical protein [Cryobacterium sp. Y11]
MTPCSVMVSPCAVDAVDEGGEGGVMPAVGQHGEGKSYSPRSTQGATLMTGPVAW